MKGYFEEVICPKVVLDLCIAIDTDNIFIVFAF